MKLEFDANAERDDGVLAKVEQAMKGLRVVETAGDAPLLICQDGKSMGYYVRCCMSAIDFVPLLDTDARLNPGDAESFRANRELRTDHNTFKRMVADAKEGREFNDIIVEFTRGYTAEKPLKIWGGQHRARAIQQAHTESSTSRSHGFRIYFNLSKAQRTELALISNTNIDVSNDLFDRLQEETRVGVRLREWCWKVGLLKQPEDFPDQASRAERVTVKLARTFVVNFYRGRERRDSLGNADGLDRTVYEPYLCESGAELDPQYDALVTKFGDAIWQNEDLLNAGKAFAKLHRAQYDAVKQASSEKKLQNIKGFRSKALTESVISAWAFVAGLLQPDHRRLVCHYSIPTTTRTIPDPLNSREMSSYHHDSDDPT